MPDSEPPSGPSLVLLLALLGPTRRRHRVHHCIPSQPATPRNSSTRLLHRGPSVRVRVCTYSTTLALVAPSTTVLDSSSPPPPPLRVPLSLYFFFFFYSFSSYHSALPALTLPPHSPSLATALSCLKSTTTPSDLLAAARCIRPVCIAIQQEQPRPLNLASHRTTPVRPACHKHNKPLCYCYHGSP